MHCYPWLSRYACDWLEENISSDWRILELGGGGSTIWFAERCGHIVTLEEDPIWRDYIAGTAEQRGLTNLTLVHQLPPFDADTLTTLSGVYDFILVDGPVKGMDFVKKGWRPWFLARVKDFVRPGGHMMVDDIQVSRIVESAKRELGEWRNIHCGWPHRGRQPHKKRVTGLWQRPA